MTSGTITVDVAPESEPISVAEAKRHLRILSPDIEDSEVLIALTAAREWCESHVARTLRDEVTRTVSFRQWPSAPLYLGYPPLLSIVSVKYYDEAAVDQTLASSNYRAVVSENIQGYLEWVADATLPSIATRDDAVRIQFKAGYSGGLVPAKAKQAILLMLSTFWGDMSGRDLAAAERSALMLLNACDWGSYA